MWEQPLPSFESMRPNHAYTCSPAAEVAPRSLCVSASAGRNIPCRSARSWHIRFSLCWSAQQQLTGTDIVSSGLIWKPQDRGRHSQRGASCRQLALRFRRALIPADVEPAFTGCVVCDGRVARLIAACGAARLPPGKHFNQVGKSAFRRIQCVPDGTGSTK